MTALAIPIILAVLGLVMGLFAYRTMQRGSARFYALERELLLRQASFALIGCLLLFSTSIVLFIYDKQLQTTLQEKEKEMVATITANTQPTPTSALLNLTRVLESLPPTLTPTPTIDPSLPTATPTRVIRRGVIEGTSGNGAYLRKEASTTSEEIMILDEGEVVTLLDEFAPIKANGYTWYKIQEVTGEVGWVVDVYLKINE